MQTHLKKLKSLLILPSNYKKTKFILAEMGETKLYIRPIVNSISIQNTIDYGDKKVVEPFYKPIITEQKSSNDKKHLRLPSIEPSRQKKSKTMNVKQMRRPRLLLNQRLSEISLNFPYVKPSLSKYRM